jgi:hypothetical protein
MKKVTESVNMGNFHIGQREDGQWAATLMGKNEFWLGPFPTLKDAQAAVKKAFLSSHWEE